MNQKKFKLGIKILVLALVIFIAPHQMAVNADESDRDDYKNKLNEEVNKTTCSTDYTKKEEIENCEKAAKACFAVLQPDKFDLSVEEKDLTKFVIKLKNASSKSATFTVTYTITKGGTALTPETKDVTVDKNKTKTLEVDSFYEEDKNIKISVSAKLTSDFSAKVTMDGTDDTINCKKQFNAVAEMEIPATVKETIKNPDWKGTKGSFCSKYLGLNGDSLSESDVKGYEELLSTYSYANIKDIETANGKGSEVFSINYSYCDSENVNRRDKNIKANILRVAKGIYKSKLKEGESNSMDPLPEGSVEIKDLSNAISLTCDAFGSFDSISNTYKVQNNIRKFHHYLDEVKPEIEYHYNYKTPEKVKLCSIKCREDLTITYGPPVAVKAGFCFEYEVKIESKVTCDSEIYKNSAPDINRYQVCEPTPICSNGVPQYINQAGPNEEFDQCIQQKYNGKYTQKAINACYNEVYGKNKNTSKKQTSLALNYLNAERMSNAISQCNPANISSEYDGSVMYEAYNINGYYGGYYVDNGKRWVPYLTGTFKDSYGEEIPYYKDCHWNKYARFYFLSYAKAQRTVGNDENSAVRGLWGQGEPYSDNLTWWKYYPQYNNTTNDGIKIGKKFGTVCSDVCSYKKYNCSGKYLNEVAPKTAPDGYTTTKDENYLSAQEAYKADYEAYEREIAKCDAAASCNTETATYTMTVNNLTDDTVICEKGADNKSCTSWTDTSNKKQCDYNSKNPTANGETTKLHYDPTSTIGLAKDKLSSCKDTGKVDSPIREVSGVCANLPGDNQTYRTIIGFPGSWKYGKDWSYVYHDPKNEINYTYKPGKYCIGTTITTVNKKWWIWDQNDLRSEAGKSKVGYTTEKDAGNVTISKITGKYNIKAFIETFGKENWKFDVQCFYAAYTTDCTKECCDPPCGNTTSEGIPEPGPLERETRAAALDNLFPSKETATGTSNETKETEEVKATKLNVTKVVDEVIESTTNMDVLKTSEEAVATQVVNSSTAGRQAGYNWSCDSTTTIIPNYPITPTALISKIQDAGEKVYNKAEEVDYKIHLTPNNINNIRKNNNSRGKDPYIVTVKNVACSTSNKNSTCYTNNNNSLIFFKSDFIRNKDYVAEFKGPSEHTCNNMKNGKCDTYKDYWDTAVCSKLGN